VGALIVFFLIVESHGMARLWSMVRRTQAWLPLIPTETRTDECTQPRRQG
jgi:hypothetical protein